MKTELVETRVRPEAAEELDKGTAVLGQEVTNTLGRTIPTSIVLYLHMKPFAQHVKIRDLRVASVVVWQARWQETASAMSTPDALSCVTHM